MSVVTTAPAPSGAHKAFCPRCSKWLADVDTILDLKFRVRCASCKIKFEFREVAGQLQGVTVIEKRN